MTLIAFPGAETEPLAEQPTEVHPAVLELTPKQKAAVLVLQLGREEASRVLSQLSEAQLEELSVEIARMDRVPQHVANAVLDEFSGLLASTATSPARGGMDTARSVLTASIGRERASAIVERVSHNIIELPFTFLQQLDHRQIVSFLCDEHPQTIALVLAHLSAGTAAPILAGLTRDLQADVAHRIAVMDRTSPELIRQVEASLERRLSSMGVRADLSTVGGLRPLVDIINRADRGTEKLIIEGLEQVDPKLAEQVRAQMFMFEDIVQLEDRAIQLVVRQVQVNDLAVALKGVSDAVRAKVMQNMSERAAITLADELDVLGPTRVAVVEEAQASVVRVIRQLEESGEITIGRGEDDAFVA